MRRMLSRLRRSKSGVSTILGALIFVGILFTCVIPLFLYVNQVNSIYDKTVIEKRQFDQEREMERLEVYAFPVGDLTELNVYIKNRCALEVTVVRVWVNDMTPTPTTNLPLRIAGISYETIKGIQIPSIGDFDVWIVTEKGNVFASQTNTLHITAEGWSGGNEPYSINIIIEKPTGQRSYNVKIFPFTGTPPSPDLENPVYSTDVSSVRSYILLWVPVGYEPGTYYVTVTRDGSPDPFHTEDVNVGLSNPSPWVYVEDV